MSRPLALDLFCGAGGATRGLQMAGFEVVGIDIKKQPRYVGEHFIQADALNPPFDLSRFDLIWASPPCQAYTTQNAHKRRAGQVKHPELIEPVRAMLAGHPHTIIENVPGAPLRVDLALDGSMFCDLRVIRRRHFELSFSAPFKLGFDCRNHVSRHQWATVRKAAGLASNSRAARLRLGLPINDPKAHAAACMQIDWMSRDELGEAIPPAYSEFIGRWALRYLGGERAA